VTHLRKIMLEELPRRNYAQTPSIVTFAPSNVSSGTSTVPRTVGSTTHPRVSQVRRRNSPSLPHDHSCSSQTDTDAVSGSI
jgi:hypothetical protein